MKYFRIVCICLSMFILLAGCASKQPVPFQLIDSSAFVSKGSIFFTEQRIEVLVDDQLFKGFIIVASQVSYSETYGGRLTTLTTVTNSESNSARAHLKSEKGQELYCEFLYEGTRAIGECKSPEGKVYQLSAENIN